MEVSKMGGGSNSDPFARNSPGIISQGIREPLIASAPNSIQVKTHAAWGLDNGNHAQLDGEYSYLLSEYNPSGVLIRRHAAAGDQVDGTTYYYARHQFYKLLAIHQNDSGDVCIVFCNTYARNRSDTPALLIIIQKPDGSKTEHKLYGSATLLYQLAGNSASYTYQGYYGIAFDSNLGKFILWPKLDPQQRWNASGGVVLGIDESGVSDVNSYHIYSKRKDLDSVILQGHISYNEFFSPYSDNVVSLYTQYQPLRSFVANLLVAPYSYSSIVFLQDRIVVANESSVITMANSINGSVSYRRSFQREDANLWLMEIFAQAGGNIDAP